MTGKSWQGLIYYTKILKSQLILSGVFHVKIQIHVQAKNISLILGCGVGCRGRFSVRVSTSRVAFSGIGIRISALSTAALTSAN